MNSSRKRISWPFNAEKALIDLWAENSVALRATANNKHILDGMAAAMQRLGFTDIDAEKINNKLKNLTTKYKKCKILKGVSSDSSSDWFNYGAVGRIIESCQPTEENSAAPPTAMLPESFMPTVPLQSPLPLPPASPPPSPPSSSSSSSMSSQISGTEDQFETIYKFCLNTEKKLEEALEDQKERMEKYLLLEERETALLAGLREDWQRMTNALIKTLSKSNQNKQ